MNNLNKLSLALNLAEITHIPEIGEVGLSDDSISIVKKTKKGHEVSIQIANDETPRNQSDFIISTFDGKTFTERKQTNDTATAVNCISNLLDNQ